MRKIREMVQKDDPMLRIKLPEIIVRMLKEIAKKNKRRSQDQLIKSLAKTFKDEKCFANISEKFTLDLKETYVK